MLCWHCRRRLRSGGFDDRFRLPTLRSISNRPNDAFALPLRPDNERRTRSGEEKCLMRPPRFPPENICAVVNLKHASNIDCCKLCQSPLSVVRAPLNSQCAHVISFEVPLSVTRFAALHLRSECTHEWMLTQRRSAQSMTPKSKNSNPTSGPLQMKNLIEPLDTLKVKNLNQPLDT